MHIMFVCVSASARLQSFSRRKKLIQLWQFYTAYRADHTKPKDTHKHMSTNALYLLQVSIDFN